MKHSFINTTAVALTAAIVFTSCNITSHTERSTGVDFSKYKTFSWAGIDNSKKVDRGDNDIVDNNIKNSVSEELVRKGWTEVTNNPDVLVDYTVAVKKGAKRESEAVYAYPYTNYMYGRRGIYSLWYPSALVGYHTYNVPFKEGELTVNMVDSKTNKLVWQGWAKGEINNRDITTREATAEVKSIFKKFEYPG